MTAISNCFIENEICFGRPIDSNSDIDASVDIVQVAEANSSVDVSSPESVDLGDNSCSQSLNIFMDTSEKKLKQKFSRVHIKKISRKIEIF